MYKRTALLHERGEPMPDLIIFNCIAVNSNNTSAGVFVGDNNASSWDANNKNESSINYVAGAGNIFTANFTLMSDNDFIDTPIVDSDVTGPNAQA